MLKALKFIPLTDLCKNPFTLSSLSCQLLSDVFVGIGVQLYVHYQMYSIHYYTYNVSFTLSKCKTIKMFAYNSKNVNQNGIVHKEFVVRP